MPLDDLFRRNIRRFYAFLGAVVALAVGPIVARMLIHTGSLAGRVGGVAVGVLSMLPWIAVVVAAIRQGDEFTRRMHLIAASITLAGTLVLIAAIDWLHTAHFIAIPDLILIWIAMLFIWAVALFAVKRHFERAL